MTDDELELSILEKYVERHREAAELPGADKCIRELDMREVLREFTSEEGAKLEQHPYKRNRFGRFHLYG